uniref:Semaphorin 4A n=2 Tax=Salvator merianae TaxID=96440 RepID=A0A8D0DVM9_SALMN
MALGATSPLRLFGLPPQPPRKPTRTLTGFSRIPAAASRSPTMSPSNRPALLLGRLLLFVIPLGAGLVPRLTFRREGSSRIAASFQQRQIQNYDTFLLSKDGATLYVGARDAILALDVGTAHSIRLKHELSWSPPLMKKNQCVFKKKSNETECLNFIRILVQLNETHLYACGTFAFSPTCAYIALENFTLVLNAKGQPLLLEGKGLCPFDPQHRNTAILVDGELYAGTMNNFQGNEPIISRSLGQRSTLKTDSFLTWLNADATFVGSFNILTPSDEEKVYFFFEETATEFDFFEKLTVSRVARVCKNDVGGDRVLQKKWTTFLKAHLSCAEQGRFPYTVIRHVFALPQPQQETVFYGVFASQWQAGSLGGSAVCAFSLDAIQEAFEGKYKELNKDCSRWMTYNGPLLSPRPGTCSVGPSADKALTFMKEHFLMDERIAPVNNQPLLVKQDAKYTRIAVHETRDVLGIPYKVLFLGTGEGSLHKVVLAGSGAHIIEEIRLFETPAEPVRNLLLAPEKGVLYVGYSSGVLQVPVANCSTHATCPNCVLARDPYCAWDGESCRDIRDAEGSVGDWVQDVELGKPMPGCRRDHGRGRALPRRRNDSEGPLLKELSPPLNTIVRLTCPRTSALANYSWELPRIRMPGGLVTQDEEALVVIVQRETLGTYECWAAENGFRQPAARYQLHSPLYPDVLGGASGFSREGLQHGATPLGEPRSYWMQFVTVTVLLAMSLAVVLAFSLFTYHEKLKAKSKVEGCSAPETSQASGQEKVPLKGSQSPPQRSKFQKQGPFQEDANTSNSCCVQVERPTRDTDAENNRLPSSAPADGEDARGGVAVDKI